LNEGGRKKEGEVEFIPNQRRGKKEEKGREKKKACAQTAFGHRP